MSIKYLDVGTAKGIPAGEGISYECLSCGTVLLSNPENSAACKCRNVIIDVDAGRVAVKSLENFRAFIVVTD